MGITTAGTAELPESPRRSTLQLAARVTAKKAARQAEEDEETEIEDKEWGANVLDAMVNRLGRRKEVEKDIPDHHRKQEFAQRLANFSHADEDEKFQPRF
jgi:lipoprotein NlpI